LLLLLCTARDNCRRHLAVPTDLFFSDVTLNDIIMVADEHTVASATFIGVIMTSLHHSDVIQPARRLKLLAAAVLACCMTVVTSSEDMMAPAPVRLPDKLFNESTPLFDRLVTCNNSSNGNFLFAAETWSCYNIRVDADRVRTCHPAGISATTHCNDTDGKNDIGALCRHLLQAHGIKRRLRAALFMSDESCKAEAAAATGDWRRRVVFKPHGQTFRWDLYHDGDSGCLLTLRCMLDHE
jgi:hypothetical protein